MQVQTQFYALTQNVPSSGVVMLGTLSKSLHNLITLLVEVGDGFSLSSEPFPSTIYEGAKYGTVSVVSSDLSSFCSWLQQVEPC